MKEKLYLLIDRAFDRFIKITDKTFLWFWKKFLPRKMAEEMAFLTGTFGVLYVIVFIMATLGIGAIIHYRFGFIGILECLAVVIFTLVNSVTVLIVSIEAILYRRCKFDGLPYLAAKIRQRLALWRRG